MKMNFFIKGNRKQIQLFLQILLFVGQLICSLFPFKEYYLWKWSMRNTFLIIMVTVFLLDIYGKVFIGTLVSIGNFGGVIGGQYYGDWIRANNILKVTEDMTPGMRQHYYHHPGVEIWIGCIMGVIIVGAIMMGIIKMKSKSLNQTVR